MCVSVCVYSVLSLLCVHACVCYSCIVCIYLHEQCIVHVCVCVCVCKV